MYFLEVTRQISGELRRSYSVAVKQAFTQYDLVTVDKKSTSWNVPCLFPIPIVTIILTRTYLS